MLVQFQKRFFGITAIFLACFILLFGNVTQQNGYFLSFHFTERTNSTRKAENNEACKEKYDTEFLKHFTVSKILKNQPDNKLINCEAMLI